MNIKQFGKTTLIVAALAYANAISGQTSINYIETNESKTSHAKLKSNYTLLGNVNGFTFTNFYKQFGYFGETEIDKGLVKGIGPKVKLTHANHPFSKATFGVSGIVPYMPKNTFTKISLLPVSVDNEGNLDDVMSANFLTSVNLPFDFNLSAFGGWNFDGNKKPQWNYGELDLSKKVSNFVIGYNPSLTNNGDFSPELNHRLRIGYAFGGNKNE
jgi:hypothetical protein